MRTLTGASFPMSCAVVLVAVSACDVRVEPRQDTDAELYCRQAGFGFDSMAYDDCVASKPYRGDYATAFREMKPLAEQGYADRRTTSRR